MKTITAPRPITTEVSKLNPEAMRLQRKRMSVGLTPEENAALDEIYRAAEQRYEQALSEQDVDAMAEADAEGRLLPVRRVNIHD